MNGLDPTAYWKDLNINPMSFPEPINIDGALLPSTEVYRSSTIPKYKLMEMFDCPEF